MGHAHIINLNLFLNPELQRKSLTETYHYIQRGFKGLSVHSFFSLRMTISFFNTIMFLNVQ